MELDKIEIEEILHAAACARQRGQTMQQRTLLRAAKYFADKKMIPISKCAWYKHAIMGIRTPPW